MIEKQKDYTVSLTFGVIGCFSEEEAKQQFLEVVERKDYTEFAWGIREHKSIVPEVELETKSHCKNCGIESLKGSVECSSKILCALRCYKKAVEEKLSETYKDSPNAYPSIEITEGKVNWKLIMSTYGSRSVHSFVNRATGDILKAASWNAPAKHPRGNILNADFGRSALTDYGVKYLK